MRPSKASQKQSMVEALGASYLLALLGQLVLAGDDLHRVRLSVALVLYESHRAVWPHLPCRAMTIFTQATVCGHRIIYPN